MYGNAGRAALQAWLGKGEQGIREPRVPGLILEGTALFSGVKFPKR